MIGGRLACVNCMNNNWTISCAQSSLVRRANANGNCNWRAWIIFFELKLYIIANYIVIKCRMAISCCGTVANINFNTFQPDRRERSNVRAFRFCLIFINFSNDLYSLCLVKICESGSDAIRFFFSTHPREQPPVRSTWNPNWIVI